MSTLIGIPDTEVEAKLKELDAILKKNGIRIAKEYTTHGEWHNGKLIANCADIEIIFLRGK